VTAAVLIAASVLIALLLVASLVTVLRYSMAHRTWEKNVQDQLQRVLKQVQNARSGDHVSVSGRAVPPSPTAPPEVRRP